jgi:hypothetical protein
MEKGTNQWERWFWRSKIKEECGYYEAGAIPMIRNALKSSIRAKYSCGHPHSLHENGTVFPPCGGDTVKCDIPRRKRIL